MIHRYFLLDAAGKVLYVLAVHFLFARLFLILSSGLRLNTKAFVRSDGFMLANRSDSLVAHAKREWTRPEPLRGF